MDLKEMKGIMVRRHPWEISRLHFFLTLFKKKKLFQFKSLLDVGAGDGFFAQEIRKNLFPESRLCCVDLHYLEEKEDGNISFFKSLPFERFDLVMLMDVLEHVKDEGEFLRKLLDQNSHHETFFVISVPAWQCLYSEHDKKLEHFRRYSPKKLEAILIKNGFEVIGQGSFFHSLLFPRFFTKLIERISKNKNYTADLGQWKGSVFLTLFLEWILKFDGLISLFFNRFGIKLPGLSLWVLAKVKKD